MPKKGGLRGPATRVKSVSLSAIDWSFLAALGDELKAKGQGRATTSNAIRFLISEEQRRPGRVELTKEPDGTIISVLAFFEVGDAEEGQRLMRRLDLRTGEVHHLIRAQHGPIRVDSSALESKPPSVARERKRRLRDAERRWRLDHPGEPVPSEDELLRDDDAFGPAASLAELMHRTGGAAYKKATKKPTGGRKRARKGRR